MKDAGTAEEHTRLARSLINGDGDLTRDERAAALEHYADTLNTWALDLEAQAGPHKDNRFQTRPDEFRALAAECETAATSFFTPREASLWRSAFTPPYRGPRR